MRADSARPIGAVLAFALAALLALWLPPAQADNDDAYLDISLLLFDTASPTDADADFPALQQAEAIWFPARLREALEASGKWGALRLLPAQEAGWELLLRGTVVNAEGEHLQLDIEALDSSGRIWLDQRYEESARSGVSLLGDSPADPFQAVYARIAADLEAQLAKLPAGEIARLKTLAQLNYAANLVPDRFAAYLEEDAEGLLHYRRLPPTDDPLLQRVNEVRARELLLIDVLDEQYRRYFQQIAPTYTLWRRYRQEQRNSLVDYQERQIEGDNDFRRGSYYDLKQRYERFRWMKLQEEYLAEMREGFANEIRPAELRLEDRVYRLSGSHEEQYQAWREILRELYLLDSGA